MGRREAPVGGGETGGGVGRGAAAAVRFSRLELGEAVAVAVPVVPVDWSLDRLVVVVNSV